MYDYAVDIGCGSGQSTELLSPYFQKVYGNPSFFLSFSYENNTILGYDVSENQIKEARTRNTISNIEYK